MKAEDFKKYIFDKTEEDYGVCPPPIDAQEGLNILIRHFLGEGWYTTLPISQKQVNAEAIYEILVKYPEKKSILDIFRGRNNK